MHMDYGAQFQILILCLDNFTHYVEFNPKIHASYSFILGGIHKLRWQPRGREGVTQMSTILHKLI